MPFEELVDIEKEAERLNGEKSKMLKEIERVEKKLSNKGFVSKAPANVIEEEKAKGEKYKSMLAQIDERLLQMNK
jgi:valyl-tRNA synthetase